VSPDQAANRLVRLGRRIWRNGRRSVVKLISRGGAGNAFVYTTTTTTVDANGVPTVTEDGVSVDCRG
jgi:hypothetical protein